jgi:hypothetical protein
MEYQATNQQTPANGAQAESSVDGILVARCGALLSQWRQHILPIVEENRDAAELDITSQEARARKIVAGNEVYIGRRVISDNMRREMPAYLQYINGPRVLIAQPKNIPVPATITTAIEDEFTLGFRYDGWLEQHICISNSSMLHGRGVFMVLSAPDTLLGTKAVYVAADDFAIPTGARDLQRANMLGVRYSISVDQFRAWGKTYGWKPDAMTTIVGSMPQGEEVTRMIELHQMFYRINDVVNTCWYADKDSQVLLRGPVPYTSGAFDETGQPVPATQYPFFPIYYNITENPILIERKGRAHMDMHDQEALTMMWTGLVNTCMRASEIYASVDATPQTENPAIQQTEFVVEPGRIIDKKVTFFNTPWPDSMMLSALNALGTTNSAAAGQVDFAVTNRKDSRKTAKELDLATDQSAANKSVPLTMFTSGYKPLLTYQFTILRTNIAARVNQTFLAPMPEARQALVEMEWVIHPAGDVDYVERLKQLDMYVKLYPMIAQTAAGPEFLRKIVELAFPKDYKSLEPYLKDNTRGMLQALLTIVQQVPTESLPPEAAAKLQEIVATAQQMATPDAPEPAQA